MEFSIVHVGCYRNPEKFRQRAVYWHLGLVLAGEEYMRYFTPEGLFAGSISPPQPTLTLLPPGGICDFQFNRNRENWVIQGMLTGMAETSGFAGHCVEYDSSTLKFNYQRPLTGERAAELREEFRRIHKLWQSQTPGDRLAADLSCGRILAEFLLPLPSRHQPESPAERFRRIIDNDATFSKTLTELSREAGGAPGYLRKIFQDAFLLSPTEYRIRRRVNRILELLDMGILSFKEIATEVGMHHVTHLYLFLRKNCNATPSELRLRHLGK